MTQKQVRKPIITVLGHVDAGKTRLLDAVRGTAIAEKEAGGITQHIGATEVPLHVIEKLSGELLRKYGFKLHIPGLLFIDTPGHEAFTNLRRRGGSIADLAVVVVDVHKGLQPQTREAIEILKSYKVPFLVALNKVDTLRGWHTEKGAATASLARQAPSVLVELDTKLYELVGQLHGMGFLSERFDRVREYTKEVAIVPMCAKSGEGIPELLMFLAGLSQKFMEKKLAVHVEGPGRGTVLEVKEERGLGKTVDVILYDGSVHVGDEFAVGGKSGVITTKVRALLEPKPLDEMRDPSEKFKNIKEVHAASGVKVAAPGLDEALAGSLFRVVSTGNEAAEIEEEIERIKVHSEQMGAIVRADTLGALEALVKLLTDHGIAVRRADIGEVSRRDVMEAESVKEKDEFKGVVFSFHSRVKPEALEEAKNRDVKVFEGDVVYRLLEEFDAWKGEAENREVAALLAKLTLPAKFTLLPGHVFRNTKPVIVGVRVEAGRLRKDVEVMKAGKVVGKVRAIQSEGKNVGEAKAGTEVAVSIDGPTMGRGLEERDALYTFIPANQFAAFTQLKSQLSAPEWELLEEIREMEEKA